MKQTLQNYALIAEIAGGVAVVLSLLYVGYQIQLNTSERRTESIRSITQGNRDLALIYVNNRDAGIAWHKVLDGIPLSEREFQLMSDSLYAHLMLLEETYNMHREGYVEDEFMASRVALIEQKILWSDQLRHVYGSMKEDGIFSSSFIDWLDEKLENSKWYRSGNPNSAESTEAGHK
jgi:hypothetical protein